MPDDLQTAKIVISAWENLNGYSPTEFITLNALMMTCVSNDGEILLTASIADIAQIAKLPRETVRRALYSLKEKDRVRIVGKRWLPSDEIASALIKGADISETTSP